MTMTRLMPNHAVRLSATLLTGLLASFFIPDQVMAADLLLDNSLLTRIDREEIAHEAGWLSLMHYRRQRNGTWKSEAISPSFFLDGAGRIAPKAELVASLGAILSGDRGGFACRFPARYEWLVKRFQMAGAPDVAKDCPSLASWYSTFSGDRISVSFASSYLESPSSMFGHTFLKISSRTGGELLSQTVNYAAKTDAKVSDIEFVRKGLFGGFPGEADILPFYRRLRTYSEDDGRDIWEYELNLTPSEIRLLLLHVWETKDGTFDYYFIDENCAYQTLALIDVARPDLGLLKEYTGATLPIDTIRTLKASGLVTAQQLWPAFPKLVRNHEQQIGVDDAQLALRISNGKEPPEDFGQFQPARQAAILQLAYEFLSVQISRDKSDRNSRKTVLNSIVKRRFELNATASLTDGAGAIPPENGHETSHISLGRFQGSNGSGYSLAWAGFQHTLTDNLAGYEPYTEITILNPEVRLYGGQTFQMQRVDWIAVKSMVPRSSLFPGRSWSVLLSTRNRIFEDGYHHSTAMTYASGQAWSFGKTVIAFLPGVSLEAGSALRHNLAASVSFSLSIDRQGDNWSSQLQVDGEKMLLGSTMNRISAQLLGSQHLSRNTSIVYTAKRFINPRTDSEFGVALKYFFHQRAF